MIKWTSMRTKLIRIEYKIWRERWLFKSQIEKFSTTLWTSSNVEWQSNQVLITEVPETWLAVLFRWLMKKLEKTLWALLQNSLYKLMAWIRLISKEKLILKQESHYLDQWRIFMTQSRKLTALRIQERVMSLMKDMSRFWVACLIPLGLDQIRESYLKRRVITKRIICWKDNWSKSFRVMMGKH